MKKLILVRHAKSSWDFPELVDFDRPLNDRGEKNAPEMADRFLKNKLMPDLMLTSGAKRAYETAKVFAGKLKCPSEKLLVDNNLFHASPGTILKIVKSQPEAIETLMIFGHNPGFTDFANMIGDLQVENIPTCGIYAVSFDTTWRNIDQKRGKVFYLDFPKMNR